MYINSSASLLFQTPGFQDFRPFWEFVLARYTPVRLVLRIYDKLRPEVRFANIPKRVRPTCPPAMAYRFFGKRQYCRDTKT